MAWWFEYNGFTFAETTTACVEEASGLDLPDMRSTDVVIPGQHGVFPGYDRLAARTVALTAYVKDLEGSPFFTTMQGLALATAPRDDELPLTFQFGDDQPTLRINCRPRRRHTDISQVTTYGVARVNLEFVASDPLVYTDEESSSSADAPEAPQGRAFSASFAYNFGVPGTGGVVSAFNAGNAPTAWVARIFGPCVNPVIIGPTGQLTWEDTLQAGEYLEFNAHPSLQTVQVGGTSSRFAQLSDDSSWFLLDPGYNNIVLNTGDGNGSILFTWRSAYWSAI